MRRLITCGRRRIAIRRRKADVVLLRMIRRRCAIRLYSTVRRLVARVNELISIAGAVLRINPLASILLLVINLLRPIVSRLYRPPSAERERLFNVFRRRDRRCGGCRRGGSGDLRRGREPVQRVDLILVRLDGARRLVVGRRDGLLVAGR